MWKRMILCHEILLTSLLQTLLIGYCKSGRFSLNITEYDLSAFTSSYKVLWGFLTAYNLTMVILACFFIQPIRAI